MGRKTGTITLTEDQRSYLELQTRARTIQAQTVCRARILLLRADGVSIDDIADKVGINRCSVMLCLNKFKEGGVENALFDAPGRGRNAEITDDEKAWIINIACQKPVDLGYSAEVWTRALLTKHINKFAEEEGHTRLSTISQSKVRTILKEADIKPNKITYYCENRDPDFDEKMHNVLLVYKQLSLQFDENGQLIPFSEDDQVVHVLSYDEKPGIQAIANTSEDLMPDENHKTISRDYEYKRLGTISLLAGIDLQTSEAIPLVRDKHSSKEYIEFLKKLDDKYPKTDKIRLVLDNLKVHSSEETRKYLATVPGRFEFVFTPKHGSWLNLVEGFFSKLTRQMHKGIRVKTKDELVQRIYKYFDEVNEEPVVYHWKYRLDEIDPSEKVVVDTLPIKKVELITDGYTRKPKGKPTVENHVRYLEIHLVEKLKEKIYVSFEDLNAEIKKIVAVLNKRSFQGKDFSRQDAFEKYDKPCMKPLPGGCYTACDYKAILKVPNNYHIEYDGYYYSVLYSYCGKPAILKATASEIRICDQYNRLICTHKRSYREFPLYITVDEHMPPEHLYYKEVNSKDGNYYRRWASAIGPAMSELIDRLLKSSKHEEQSYNACAGILHKVKTIPKGAAEEVARKCIEINSCKYFTFKQMLKKMDVKELPEHSPGTLPNHENIRGKDYYK